MNKRSNRLKTQHTKTVCIDRSCGWNRKKGTETNFQRFLLFNVEKVQKLHVLCKEIK